MSNPLRQCINANGIPKKKYKTFELAVKAARKINKNPKTIWKQEAYKCKVCLKYHTGRNKHNIKAEHNINIYNY